MPFQVFLFQVQPNRIKKITREYFLRIKKKTALGKQGAAATAATRR